MEIHRVLKREGNMTLNEQGGKTGSSPLLGDSDSGCCNGMFYQYSRRGERKRASEVEQRER
jgi:hypothetical protein